MLLVLVLFGLFTLIIITLFVELKFSKAWNPVYFRSGISVFHREIRANKPLDFKNIKLSDIKNEFSDEGSQNMEFKKLSDTEIAFRECFDQSKSILNNQMLHGIIGMEGNDKILVKGRLNWYAAFFPIVFVLFVFLVPVKGNMFYEKILMIGVMLLIVGFLYFAQRNRYERVSNKIEEIVNK